MRKKIALISPAATAAGLLVAGLALAASPSTSLPPVHAVLAADTTASPPVNLDNCPTLAKGYHGGCVDQLQTELNTIDNAGLGVDGTFGLQTQRAVEIFQQQNGVSPADGIVGPLTKAALDGDTGPVVTTPQPGAPLPSPSPPANVSPENDPGWCLASTSSPCPPLGLLPDHHPDLDDPFPGDVGSGGFDQVWEAIGGLF